MTQPIKLHRLFAATLFIFSIHNTFCMKNTIDNVSEEIQSENYQETIHKLKEKLHNLENEKLEEKLKVYKRNNDVPYRIMSTLGDDTMKGFIQFCSQSASGAVLEVVRRELDIRYDNNPTTKVQLEEIAGGLTIIANGVTLTEDLAKKRNSLEAFLLKNTPEREKKQKEIDVQARNAYEDLWHLRNEHIDQLNNIRKKRNPNFVPYSAKQN